tara:strand:+ start:393 stop:518 length:126 start_codon:yes stop_codon:yes gene_type:complete
MGAPWIIKKVPVVPAAKESPPQPKKAAAPKKKRAPKKTADK